MPLQGCVPVVRVKMRAIRIDGRGRSRDHRPGTAGSEQMPDRLRSRPGHDVMLNVPFLSIVSTVRVHLIYACDTYYLL